MGKSNIAVGQWLSDRVRFADLFNGILFRGRQVVLPEDLQLADRESDVLVKDKEGNEKGVQRYRDVVMRWKENVELAILACENQKKVHYAMPIRIMLYDSLTYIDQARQIWKENGEKSQKVTEEEYLSKFRKEDKIYPVITIVFYYGTKEWDGSKDLYEMFRLNKELKNLEILRKYIPNYHINLVDAENIENLKVFRTDLQVVLGMLKYRRQKNELLNYIHNNEQYFKSIDLETYQAVRELLNSEKQLKLIIGDEKEEIDMCQALEELYEDGVEKGIEEGIKALIETCKEFREPKERTISRVMEKCSVSKEAAEEYIRRYW